MLSIKNKKMNKFWKAAPTPTNLLAISLKKKNKGDDRGYSDEEIVAKVNTNFRTFSCQEQVLFNQRYKNFSKFLFNFSENLTV